MMIISFGWLNNLDKWFGRYRTFDHNDWKLWFAWRPVFVDDDKLVWLRIIERYDKMYANSNGQVKYYQLVTPGSGKEK